jgi:hypothetical protein
LTQSNARPVLYVIHGGRLTDIAVRNAKARDRAFKKADGRGLCLLVQPNGAKWWRFRYRWDGKERMLSVGTYPDTSLAEARQERELCRKDLSNGVNPAVRRAAQYLPERTYNNATWALETYVYPEMGTRQISSITTSELLAVLKKIESKGLLETARRTKLVVVLTNLRKLASRNPAAPNARPNAWLGLLSRFQRALRGSASGRKKPRLWENFTALLEFDNVAARCWIARGLMRTGGDIIQCGSASVAS